MLATSHLGLLVGLCLSATTADPSLADRAREFDLQLRSRALPYWLDETRDQQFGGYLLEVAEKQLVGQARMIWGFSHAHRHGLSTPDRDYLQAARQGVAFLQKHFHDAEHGGYFWMTDREGRPTNRHKMIYGQAFVIYALVEYYRASNDMEVLAAALEQFLVLKNKAYDTRYGGWFEHFAPDWTPVMTWQDEVSVEVPGFKSANAHLHLMEAFTELYLELKDDRVRAALEESLKINRNSFFPLDPAQCAFHCHPDWKRVTDKASEGLSYGHNVEFAWLMLRAEQALGQPLSWDHFYAHLDHALKYGFDHDQGGLYNKGLGNEAAFDREKVWWAQAELMAALTVSRQHRRRRSDDVALTKLMQFLQEVMIDPQDGIWVASVTADGKPKWDSKKNHWKANYHDVRAIVMFVDALKDAE